MTKNDYNVEPVEYCMSCGSLHIKDNDGHAVCMNCGSVDFTDKTTIDEYISRYGN